jgi:hypothetical protein
MGIKRLTYKDIPTPLRARAAGDAQRRLQGVLSDPTATPEQRGLARQQQTVLRHWTGGTLPSQLEAVPDIEAPEATDDLIDSTPLPPSVPEPPAPESPVSPIEVSDQVVYGD